MSTQPPLTEAQITAAARALNKRHAELCNVNEADSWLVQGHDFREDARLALEAARAAVAEAQPAPEQPAQRTPASISSADVERLIAECIPGGSVCDPQAVADAVRRYCNAWPEQSAQRLTDERLREMAAEAESPEWPEWYSDDDALIRFARAIERAAIASAPRVPQHIAVAAAAVHRQLDEAFPREELDLDAVRMLADAFQRRSPPNDWSPADRGELAGDGKPCPNTHDPDCRWPDCMCRKRAPTP